jgi:hypothetical protein
MINFWGFSRKFKTNVSLGQKRWKKVKTDEKGPSKEKKQENKQLLVFFSNNKENCQKRWDMMKKGQKWWQKAKINEKLRKTIPDFFQENMEHCQKR